MKGKGALTDGRILQLLHEGSIHSGSPNCVNPASLDLRIKGEIYRIDAWFLPGHGQSVTDMVRSVNPVSVDVGGVLECSAKYLVRVEEQFVLPGDIYGYCNPKSSIGRLGVDVRVIADGINRYDSIPKGYAGSIWVMLAPRHIPIRVSPGSQLVQLRLFNADTRFTEKMVGHEVDNAAGGLIYSKDRMPIRYRDITSNDFDGYIIVSIDLEGEVCGWECLENNRLLDIEERHYHPCDFFRPIYGSQKGIFLSKGKFYIFATKERVRVPPWLACEMRPMDERAGGFQVHKAGYIDPGYGYGSNGEGRGRSIVLEVTPYDDMVIRHGQTIGKIRFERTCKIPKKHYDHGGRNSHYTIETPFPRLAKQFDVWE